MKYLLITIAAMILVGCFDKETPSIKSTATSIHKAVIEGGIEAVNQSLEASIDINAKDEKGWAPMHLVAISGNKVIAELLLENGANVNERTAAGWTPLHLADDKKIAQLLITKGANLNAQNNDGETPLDWAIKRKDIATTDLLRKHGAKTNDEM